MPPSRSARRERRSIVDETERTWRQSLSFENVVPSLRWMSTSGGGREGQTRRGHRRILPIPPKVLESLEETQIQAQVHHVDQVDQSERLFQDRLDECSESDVIRHCQSLNEKINSAVLSLVDEWVEKPTFSRSLLRGISVFFDSRHEKHLRKAIGVPICSSIEHRISSPPSEGLQDLVTDALQSLAIRLIYQFVSESFSPGMSPSTNEGMREMFETMLLQAPLPTALRWRALTYKYSFVEPRPSIDEYQCLLSHYFRDIFCLAGESTSSKFLSGIQDAVMDSEIVESALELSELLKTKLFSVYLDIYTIQPGETFCEDNMEFDSSNKDAVRNRRVLCSLELGLREIEISPQTGPGRILLKPKVALEK